MKNLLKHILTTLVFLQVCSLYGQTPQIETISKDSKKSYEFDFPCVSELSLFPNESSFNNDNDAIPGNSNVGKILIWAREDERNNINNFHTSFQEFDNEGYGLVRIEAHFPSSYSENTVYFKVEDTDDQSPYEQQPANIDDIDNWEGFGFSVGLKETKNSNLVCSETLEIDAEIGNTGNKVATAYLQITRRYSGDNYIVKTSLDPGLLNPFTADPADTKITSNLVSWKRAYLNYKPMLEKGTIIRLNNTNFDPPNMLRVSSVEEFSVNDNVKIFFKDGTVFFRYITSVDPVDRKLFFNQDHPSNIPDNLQYGGVVKASEVHEVSDIEFFEERLIDAFGYNGNGNDSNFDSYLNSLNNTSHNVESGGAFVEFVINNANTIPHFQKDTNPLSFDLNHFFQHWSGNEIGTVDLFFGGRYTDTGLSETVPLRYSVIFNKGWRFNEALPNPMYEEINLFTDAILNTFPHELGHQFNIGKQDNADQHTDQEQYTGVIFSHAEHRCIMTYNEPGVEIPHQFMNNAEFDSHYTNPFGFNDLDKSCIGDIRIQEWPLN